MMRLWCDFDFDHLAYLFGTTIKTARKFFHKMLRALDNMFKHEGFGLNEHSTEAMAGAKPLPCFKRFPRTAIVLDCTDVRIQKPGKSETGKLFYSDYKKGYTTKILIGINSEGKVVFVSTCKPGKISDKHITEVSDVLKWVPNGWKVMVDKGFLIEKLPWVEKAHLEIIRPPLLHKSKQFTPQQAAAGEAIAQARIHVERVIQRAKMFRILSRELLNSTMSYASMTVRVCLALTNLMGDIVLEK